ncbi:unnamed protein product [Blepharisma stoltei]|uniref:Uncharacterized protein n=1 Tax=Blepharisma stoltei TaxID=1481888 RepID=A0AAU9IS94_9CILI|nr:unnamed protein product [Blepharisma stoltei]
MERQEKWLEKLDLISILRWATSGLPSQKLKYAGLLIPFDNDYILYDISTKSKGCDEDKTYIKDDLIRTNIRRGNSIFVKPQKEIKKYIDPEKLIKDNGKDIIIENILWARKGLSKFFDLSIEFLNHRQTKNLMLTGSFSGSFPISLSSSHKEAIRRMIFYEAEFALLREGATIDLYKLNKANGENAQFSYSPHLNAWIIASKNVSLAARVSEDLKIYSNNRYEFVKVIGEEWFKILLNLNEQELEELKQDLTGFTIAGEYVGDLNHQHLVRYQKIDIMFYAYINNESSRPCLPPLRASALFAKYRLKSVKMEHVGNFASLAVFYSALENLYKSISSQSLESEEEGSVIYIVKNDHTENHLLTSASETISQENFDFYMNPEFYSAVNSQETLSLCKIKTLEYRIFRKLRQKAKAISSKKNPANALILLNKLKKEVKDLVKDYELPRPLDYYFEIAATAFEYVKESKYIERFKKGYIDFLDKIRQIVDGVAPVPFLSHEKSIERKPLSIIINSPPCFITPKEAELFLDVLKPNEVVYQWNETSKVEKGFKLCFLSHRVKISKNFKQNALIVFYGATSEGIIRCEEELKAYANANPSTVPSCVLPFLKRKDIGPRLSKLLSEWTTDKEFLQNQYPAYVIDAENKPIKELLEIIQERIEELPAPIENDMQKVEEEQKECPEKPICSGKMAYIIVPMGIPCMGKASFLAALQRYSDENGIVLKTICSDDIRNRCMSEYMKKRRNYDREKAFRKTHNSSRTTFFDQLKNATMSNSHEKQIIFLDKNHPPKSIMCTLQEIKAVEAYSNLKLIALVPECREPLIIQLRNKKKNTYEISLSMLIQCLLRVRDRKQHDIINGKLFHRLSIVLMMYQMYQNVKFEDYLSTGFSYIMRIPFTDESSWEIDPNLTESIIKVLSGFDNNEFPHKSIVTNLEQEIEKSTLSFPIIDPYPALCEQINLILNGNSETKNDEIQREKAPTAIEIEFNVNSKPGLISIILENLEKLASHYEDQEIRSDLAEIHEYANNGNKSIWNVCDELLHTETVNIDKNYDENLEEKLHIKSRVTHIIYIPKNTIYCCSCIDVENDSFPLKNLYIPVLAYQNSQPINNFQLKQVIISENSQITEIQVDESPKKAYSIPLSELYKLEGSTQLYY